MGVVDMVVGITLKTQEAGHVVFRIEGDKDEKLEALFIEQLKSHKMFPFIPQDQLKTDFVFLSGVDPSQFGTSFKFRNYKESYEEWYYMPWWGLSRKDAYYVMCGGTYNTDTPELWRCPESS